MIAILGNNLAELEQQLDELKRQALVSPPHETLATQRSSPANVELRAKIAELKRRTTRTTGRVWDMLTAVAARTQPCTLHELAQDLGLPHAGSVHSLIAILGRPCSPKHLNLTVLERIPGHPSTYRMPDEVRTIINELR
jgi:hypothetical protein